MKLELEILETFVSSTLKKCNIQEIFVFGSIQSYNNLVRIRIEDVRVSGGLNIENKNEAKNDRVFNYQDPINITSNSSKATTTSLNSGSEILTQNMIEKYSNLAKEHRRLSPIVKQGKEYIAIYKQVKDDEEILKGNDLELKEIKYLVINDQKFKYL